MYSSMLIGVPKVKWPMSCKNSLTGSKMSSIILNWVFVIFGGACRRFRSGSAPEASNKFLPWENGTIESLFPWMMDVGMTIVLISFSLFKKSELIKVQKSEPKGQEPPNLFNERKGDCRIKDEATFLVASRVAGPLPKDRPMMMICFLGSRPSCWTKWSYTSRPSSSSLCWSSWISNDLSL